ncbi:MAG: methyltransferase [Desulfobacteraceae bacterium]|nr:methyltransferase [Desulfobacteraceae bacterium]
MSFFLNQTEHYHKNDMNDLMWEVTVCNSIEPANSPVRQILTQNRTYGELLAAYLFNLIPKKCCNNVMEVGGGYGYLMRDLLGNSPNIKANMVDISPAMMARQRQTLAAFDVNYLQSNFFDIDPGLIQSQDLVIMNEIVGDFPTACQITNDMVSHGNYGDKSLDKIREYVTKGIIELPEDGPTNLNIGAIQALDKLCSCHVPYIFLSEHSCEAMVKDHMAPYIKLEPLGNPQEIRLIGHSEYTIRFSHLESIAHSFGYRVVRGNYTDFIKVNFSNRIYRIFKSNSQKDAHEIIRHFIEDLYIYEYLLLIREPLMSGGST